MHIFYEALKNILKENNISSNVDETTLIELLTGFNDDLYIGNDEYKKLVLSGNGEFDFVKERLPKKTKPVYIKPNNGVVYGIALSPRGGIFETKRSIEMALQDDQKLMKRNDVNPELIGLYTKRKFRKVMNFIDNGQFKKAG